MHTFYVYGLLVMTVLIAGAGAAFADSDSTPDSHSNAQPASGRDIHGNPLGTNVHGNPNDLNAQGNRPKDVQGNPPHDMYGNKTGTENKP